MHFKGVMITWKNGVGTEQQAKAAELFDALPGTVPGIEALYFGRADPAFKLAEDDFGLFFAFADRNDAEAFERHPDSVAANEYVASLSETRQVFEWEMPGDWMTQGDWKTQGTDPWTAEGISEDGLYCHMTFVRWKAEDSEPVAAYESALVGKGSLVPKVVSMAGGRAEPGATENDDYHFGIMVTYTDRQARQDFNIPMADTIKNFLNIADVYRLFDFYNEASASRKAAQT
jgi:Stress responsive A/B Barrel Domain